MGTLFAAVILACNEDNVLARCVESLAGLAELHISVDTASCDQTEALARQLTPHVYAHSFDETDSFSACRNKLQDAAEAASEHDWFLWIDPDEWLAEGREGIASVLRQADAQGRGSLMVRMVDVPAGSEPGTRGASWQNCKFFKRGQRFLRRRHEHLPVNIDRACVQQIAIHHQKLQRADVQAACATRKNNMPALVADYDEFRDQRACYYVGEAFLSQQQDAHTALAWFERGLTLPDTIMGARSQLCAGVFAAQRALLNFDAARHATHGRWACDWRDSADCAWQLGSIAADEGGFEEAEHWFKWVLSAPPAEPGMNQILSASPAELAHWGLAVVASKQGKLTELDSHLRAAERYGAKPEYAQLRGMFAASAAKGAAPNE